MEKVLPTNVASDEYTADYGPNLSAAQHSAKPPRAFSSRTNTSQKAYTAWDSQKGMSLGKQNLGSTLNFDDTAPTPSPTSDRGASFGGA